MRNIIQATDTGGAGTAHHFQRSGLVKVAQTVGFQCLYWDTNLKNAPPAFDVFDEMDCPDGLIFIGQGYNLTPAIIKCIEERKDNILVALRCSDYSPFTDKIDKNYYQILHAQEQEIKNVLKVREIINDDSRFFIFNHYTDTFMKITHEYWIKKYGVRACSDKLACDIFLYCNGKLDKDLMCGASIITSFHPYKNIGFDSYIRPMLFPVGETPIKLWSSWGTSGAQYCGMLPPQKNRDVYKSSLVNMSIAEPHARRFHFDLVERPYAVLGGGNFCVSDYSDSLKDVFDEDELILAKTPKEFQDAVKHYIRYPDERLPFMERGKKTIINGHTYFHRFSQLLNNFTGHMENEVDRTMIVYDLVKNKMKL